MHNIYAEQDWLLSNPSLNNLLDLVRHERQNGSYQWAVICKPPIDVANSANKFLLVFYSVWDSLLLCYHFTRRNKKPSPCMSGYDVDTTCTIPQTNTELTFSFLHFFFHFIHVVVSVSPAICMHVRLYFIFSYIYLGKFFFSLIYWFQVFNLVFYTVMYYFELITIDVDFKTI